MDGPFSFWRKEKTAQKMFLCTYLDYISMHVFQSKMGVSYYFQFLDYINVMAYDVYWTGYDYVMDIEALEAIGIAKVRQQRINTITKSRCVAVFLV